MMSKKLVNAMLTLAIVCSAVFAAPVADAGNAASRTTYYMENETYDDSVTASTGWSMKYFSGNYTHWESSGQFTSNGNGVGIKDNKLLFQLNNSDHANYSATKAFGETVTSGIVGIKTDFSYYSEEKSTDASYISFKNSKKEEVARFTLNMNGTVTLGSETFKATVDISSTNRKQIVYNTYTPVIEFMVDIDDNTATLVYTSEKTDTTTLETNIEDVSDIAYLEVGSVSMILPGKIELDNTTLYSYETKEYWQFDPIPLTDYADSKLRFDISYVQNETGVTATATTEKKVSEFINEFAPDSTVLSGTGEVSFGIIITDIKLNQGISRVYIVNENSPVSLSSGDFDPDAEIDEAEYIEIGDFGFDVMD